jgi:hypothetical protein
MGTLQRLAFFTRSLGGGGAEKISFKILETV